MHLELQVAGTVERCQAVLFDMDGVLVDSMSLIEDQLRQWALQRGVDPQLMVDLSPGRTNAELVAEVAPHLDAVAEERLLLEQEVATAGEVTACAGALQLIDQLPAGSWAVVTSGNRPVAKARLQAAGFGLPTVLVTADDVNAGKPDPQGYEMAARLLGLPTRACVVVEDAVAGLEAGGCGDARGGCSGHGRCSSGAAHPRGPVADAGVCALTRTPGTTRRSTRPRGRRSLGRRPA